jgi:hypothetical protein
MQERFKRTHIQNRNKNQEQRMKNAPRFAIALLLISLAIAACGSSVPTEAAPPVEADTSTAPSVPTATATTPPTAVPTSSPPPTVAKLQLEIVQSQAWTDRDGNVRVNVLMRNPYDFPVAPGSSGHASLLNSAGKLIRGKKLYFLDGISGGTGFVLPGETIAANACFTCETTPLPEEWGSVEFRALVEDASAKWDYHTDVEATIGNVSFDSDSPIFDVTGTVKNNSDSALARISVRIFVFDQAGNLVGAAEVSAWDVGAGATVSFNGYGIGQAPAGAVKYEVTALGVNY